MSISSSPCGVWRKGHGVEVAHEPVPRHNSNNIASSSTKNLATPSMASSRSCLFEDAESVERKNVDRVNNAEEANKVDNFIFLPSSFALNHLDVVACDPLLAKDLPIINTSTALDSSPESAPLELGASTLLVKHKCFKFLKGLRITGKLSEQTAWSCSATSTYEVQFPPSTRLSDWPAIPNATGAVSITVITDNHRNSKHDELQQLINNSPSEELRGIAKPVLVMRAGIPSAPNLFTHEVSKGVLREIEFAIFEECYEPLSTIKTTKELARIVLGAVEGLQWLDLKGFPHWDVSVSTIMIDKNGQGVLMDYDRSLVPSESRTLSRERSRSAPFMSRCHLNDSGMVPHAAWHDAESLGYVILYLALKMVIKSKKATSKQESDAKGIIDAWGGIVDIALEKKEGLQLPGRRRVVLELCDIGLPAIAELFEIISGHCGLSGVSFKTPVELTVEEDELEKMWNKKEMGYKKLVRQLKAYLKRVEK